MKKILFAVFILSFSNGYSQTEQYEVKQTSKIGNSTNYQITKKSTGPNKALIDGAYKAAPKFVDVQGAFMKGFNSVKLPANNSSNEKKSSIETIEYNEEKLNSNFTYNTLILRTENKWYRKTIEKYLEDSNEFGIYFINPDLNIKLNPNVLIIDLNLFDKPNLSGSLDRILEVTYSDMDGIINKNVFKNVLFYQKATLIKYIFNNRKELYLSKQDNAIDNSLNVFTDDDLMNQLLKLKELFDAGILTKEEFEIKSKEIKAKLIK